LAGNEKARKFQFLREIASGGFGSVYLTKITHPDGFSRLTAVKLLHRRWSDNEEISRRMRDEARLLGWLRHRHIVNVVDLTSLDGRTAIIMEYLEAVDLKEVIRASSYAGERFPLRAVFQVMMAVSSALDAAYNRPPYAGEKPLCVIHRDIKPSNIMIDDSGHVKVLDFGVARADFAERESHTRELQFGSVDYMPPERLLFEPESPGSDVYSLAATGFEIMCLEKLGKAKGSPLKHEAFVAERIESLRTHLSLTGELGESIAQLFSECLSYEPTDRPDASQVVSRCRLLSREVGGLGLAEWSEGNVPALLTEASMEEPTSMNPLTGRTYQEDSVSDTGSQALSEKTVPPPQIEDVSEKDPRWDLLRAAAATEIEVLETVEATEDAEVSVADLMPVSGDQLFVDENEDTTTSPEEGLGPSLSASMTLGGHGDDIDDMDEVATTMMPIRRQSSDDDATKTMEAPPAELTVPSIEEDEGETRILSTPEVDAVSAASAENGTESKDGQDADSDEEAPDGETIILSDETKNLLESEAVLGDRKPEQVGETNPPEAAVSESIGAETILAHSGQEFKGAGSTSVQEISGTKRFLVSLMIFLLALGAGLGLGSLLFYDELYGENGALSGLFSSEAGQEAAGEMELPGPIGDSPEADPEPIPVDPEGQEPVEASEDTIVLRSLAEGTRKLIVRCGREQFSGVDEVRFAVPDTKSCTVTAFTASAKMRSKLSDLKPGEVNCFAGGEKKCD
jgi:serine/threonine-protein kinase